jgi:hypothetical protein
MGSPFPTQEPHFLPDRKDQLLVEVRALETVRLQVRGQQQARIPAESLVWVGWAPSSWPSWVGKCGEAGCWGSPLLTGVGTAQRGAYPQNETDKG